MGIYIRGMEPPETCLECPIQFAGFCYANPPKGEARVAKTVNEVWEQGKPDWCPLIEVKEPHGDLADVSEVKKCLHDLPDSEDKWGA